MKKLLFIIGLLMLSSVFALNDTICEDVIEPNNGCQMVTPTLDCTVYNYSVYYRNSTSVENGTLSVWNDNIYYFNFSQDTGEYIIKLCDDTTKEVIVKGEEIKMIGTILVVSVMILIFLALTIFFYAQNNGLRHACLSLTFIFMTILTFTLYKWSSTFSIDLGNVPYIIYFVTLILTLVIIFLTLLDLTIIGISQFGTKKKKNYGDNLI